MELLKHGAAPLTAVLFFLFDMCIREGSYVTHLKLSKISALFKGKGKRDCIDSYRLVSIKPVIAKVLKKKALTQFFLFDQCSLRLAVYIHRGPFHYINITREIIRRVLSARESKQQVGMICCDLLKAFDVADRDVLAVKLRHYVVCGAAHALLTDLKQDRYQIVVAGGGTVRSEPLRTEMGMAQGLSVSNILFS